MQIVKVEFTAQTAKTSLWRRTISVKSQVLTWLFQKKRLFFLKTRLLPTKPHGLDAFGTMKLGTSKSFAATDHTR